MVVCAMQKSHATETHTSSALRGGRKTQKEIVHRNYCQVLCVGYVRIVHIIAVYWCTSVAEVTKKMHMHIPSTTLT